MPTNPEILRHLQQASGSSTTAILDKAPEPPKEHEAPRAYSVRLAGLHEERLQAFRLRFLVFNLELNEGLESAYETGYDRDEFDSVCDHLIVEHIPTARVIATYRMQTGKAAAANLGYYSAREFDFSVYDAVRDSLVEVGRAAILQPHRNFEVLNLLWKGIAAYARQNGGRYLVGCSSMTSQVQAEGIALYGQLQPFLAAPEWRTRPRPGFALNPACAEIAPGSVTAPRLLRAYLNLGARICGEPALDREFKTIDFLTLLDLESLSPVARSRFLDTAWEIA
jgi:putative hemolysin